ncbi:MAG TPA: 7TM diverse intracellular signaling domain-containing protein [Hydrogenophaga sp.]|nr:7TM diverse intracellular signaling domain-containing protein [Hydrogenophaga sp.]
MFSAQTTPSPRPRRLLAAFVFPLWLWMLGALCAPLGAWAQQPALAPIVLDSAKSSVPLAQRSLYWVDPAGDKTVQWVEENQHQLPFVVRDPGHRVLLDGKAALWVRFDAQVKDALVHWELELAYSGTDHISLYHRTADDQWSEQRAGDRFAVNDWVYADRFPVMALDTRIDVPVTYWVRIEHARVPFSGPLTLHNHNALRELRIHQQFFLGAYFGMVLLLATVAIANAAVFRDSSFAFYAAYITVLGLAQASSLGVAGQFLWPDSPRWNGMAEFVLLPMVAVVGLLFVRHVVQPRRLGRGLNRAALVLATLLLLLMVWDQVALSSLSLQAVTVGGAATMALVYVMLWAAWRTGDRWVRWIALGILPVLLTGALPVMRNLDLLSSGFLSQYGMVIAAALEAPLLFYGLLQRSSVQHEAQTRARALALTEPLTGLTNRHNGMLRLHESLVRAQRYNHSIALLLIDLDNHAWFESEHGREVADRALVLTGSLLRAVARDVDTATRVDDSSFALLMEGPVRAAQAVAAATRILAGGLRPSTQLPVGTTLRYKIVVAMLPEPGLELLQDAQAHLQWLRGALNDLRDDKRKSIHTVNF